MKKIIKKRIEQLAKKAKVSEEYLATAIVIGCLFANKKPEKVMKELEENGNKI